MMREKPKSRSTPPPDYRLARAFHFTGVDLAVNRSGYMTRRQQGLLNVMVQSSLAWVYQRLLNRQNQTSKHGFRRVASVYGRIRLEDYRPDYRHYPQGKEYRTWNEMEYHQALSPQQYRATQSGNYRVALRLLVEATDFQAPITEEQYLALAKNRVYRIYYDPARPNRILSLERITGADETD